MKIKTLQQQHRPAWNQAVHEIADASFFHLAEWQDVIAGSYRFPAHYLYAEDTTGICGLLPLYRVSTPMFGSSLLSVPLGVYGGAVGHSPAICQQLEDAALQLANTLKLGYVELRNTRRQREGWPINARYATFKKTLLDNEQDNLLAIPQKQRAEIRKGLNAELGIRTDRDADRFYPLYAQSVHKLGTPVYPRQLFRLLTQVFPEHCDIFWVRNNKQVLAAVLSFYFKDQVLPYYGAGTSEARQHSAFPFLYWELMRQSANRGYRQFDFGRSIKGSGAYAFKKNFGFSPQPLSYQQQLVCARRISAADPDNPVHLKLSRLWRMMPLTIANRLGPWVSRMIV